MAEQDVAISNLMGEPVTKEKNVVRLIVRQPLISGAGRSSCRSARMKSSRWQMTSSRSQS